MTTTRIATTMAMSNENWVPLMISASMSRPSWSVPNG